MPTTTREIRLASRPDGVPTPQDFELAETELPDPGPGEVLVRTTYMSVDPYMRGRMNEGRSYTPPFQVGKALDGGAVGEVIASNDESVPVGATVQHRFGWREHAIVPAAEAQLIDTGVAPAATFLSVLGMTGMTAWVGLTTIAGLKQGDVVFVSGAAGAVGSAAGQIAKLRGHTVIGSAGSPEKVAWLRDELGFDAAFDYHDGPVVEQLRAAAPDGIDVYFDNVGGETLDAALALLRRNARIAICGAISGYNATEPPPGPSRYLSLLVNRASMTGFLVFDYADRYAEAAEAIAGWLADGSIVAREQVVEGGVEKFGETLLMLFDGANTGKLVLAA